jgi:hypothetical protein
MREHCCQKCGNKLIPMKIKKVFKCSAYNAVVSAIKQKEHERNQLLSDVLHSIDAVAEITNERITHTFLVLNIAAVAE